MLHRNEKEDIIRVAKQLHERNMLAAADGNISVLVGDDLLMTPSGEPKANLSPENFATLRLDGTIVSGNPSSERAMHLSIYKQCPKARAVVHAHPPTAIAWTIARPELKELPKECMSELILALGAIPIVPFARPGTTDMGKVLEPFLPEHRALVLARHGAVAWGETLQEAYNGMERLEHTALILFRAEQLGGVTFLPPSEVTYLQELRQQLGDKTL